MDDYDYMYKVLLVGDSAVGKSSILLQYVDGSFSETFISTIGVDFKIRTLETDGKRIKLQIWDTAGQERFRTITASYYRGAQGIFLVYDVTNPLTFEHISMWMAEIDRHTAANQRAAVRILVGNKIDCEERRVVSRERGAQVADQNGMLFAEVSAKSGAHLDHLFSLMASSVYRTLCEAQTRASAAKSGLAPDGSVLVGDNQPTHSASCC